MLPLRRFAPGVGASRSDSGRAFHPGILAARLFAAFSCARAGARGGGQAWHLPVKSSLLRSCHVAAPEPLVACGVRFGAVASGCPAASNAEQTRGRRSYRVSVRRKPMFLAHPRAQKTDLCCTPGTGSPKLSAARVREIAVLPAAQVRPRFAQPARRPPLLQRSRGPIRWSGRRSRAKPKVAPASRNGVRPPYGMLFSLAEFQRAKFHPKLFNGKSPVTDLLS